MQDQFLNFLEQEEKHAAAYWAEELRRENRNPAPLPLSADYWRGYADAATNALAAYAGPTNLDSIYKGAEL